MTTKQQQPRVWVGHSTNEYTWHWLWAWDENSSEPVGSWTSTFDYICPGDWFVPCEQGSRTRPIDPTEMEMIRTCSEMDW